MEHFSCYFCHRRYFLSFQNNWNNQVVLWTIPVITAELFPHLGIVGNSLIFVVVVVVVVVVV